MAIRLEPQSEALARPSAYDELFERLLCSLSVPAEVYRGAACYSSYEVVLQMFARETGIPMMEKRGVVGGEEFDGQKAAETPQEPAKAASAGCGCPVHGGRRACGSDPLSQAAEKAAEAVEKNAAK